MKLVYILIGSVSLLLGIIGLFLPLLPTTPFLLLSAACWLRGSRRLYDWLLNQRCLGPYIRNFYEYKAIPLHAKILSVSLIWITLLNCAIWIVNPIPLKVLLIALAVVISWHILSYKTLTKEQLEKNKKRTEQ
ncbi:MAG: YbaN family protein [Bacteroidales bacterium]|nr:YbaN family protein [Bacteroidales bacterium]